MNEKKSHACGSDANLCFQSISEQNDETLSGVLDTTLQFREQVRNFALCKGLSPAPQEPIHRKLSKRLTITERFRPCSTSYTDIAR